ncbi:MAG: amidohydrolase family protein [Syntrophaceae bacterium]
MICLLVGLMFIVFFLSILHLTFPSKLSRDFLALFGWLFKRHLNLLALMENDLGNYFLLTEKVLREKFNGKIEINGHVHTKIVLTPLMMDFGSKKIVSKLLPYGAEPIRKPIAEQVIALFNGIKTYTKKNPNGMFEIYPFLGVNPQNPWYDLPKLEELLNKYFGEYVGNEAALRANMGKFNGNIDELGSNFFTGIKVYPPLGFDPWPEDGEEMKKVEFLYEFCCERNIPITVHCNDGGFRVDSIRATHRRSSPEKWEQVLTYDDSKYGKLKLNLAHMGKQKSLFSFGQKSWIDIVLKLVATYENVYTDFSYIEFEDKDYKKLKQLIEKKSEELNYDLKNKILFGTDFMICLQRINTYNDYLSLFVNTKHFTGQDKELFCSVNPQKFLF